MTTEHVPAFDEGLEAYVDSKELKDNPYEDGTFQHSRWTEGWKQGKADDPFGEDAEEDEDDLPEDEDDINIDDIE